MKIFNTNVEVSTNSLVEILKTAIAATYSHTTLTVWVPEGEPMVFTFQGGSSLEFLTEPNVVNLREKVFKDQRAQTVVDRAMEAIASIKGNTETPCSLSTKSGVATVKTLVSVDTQVFDRYQERFSVTTENNRKVITVF